MKLNDLHPHYHKSFTGIFRLTDRSETFDDEGVPYVQLCLLNSSGEYLAIAPAESTPLPRTSELGDLLSVQGSYFVGESETYVLLSSVKFPNPNEYPEPGASDIPLNTQQISVEYALHAVRSLPAHELMDFLRKVLN